MRIGAVELLVVFAVALLVIGPDKLPDFARKLGEMLGQFKGYSDKVAQEIRETVVEPMEEAAQPIREAVKPLEEADRAIRGSVREVEKSITGIGRPVKKAAAPAQEPEEAPDAGEEEPPMPLPVDRSVDPGAEVLKQLQEIQAKEGQSKEEEQ